MSMQFAVVVIRKSFRQSMAPGIGSGISRGRKVVAALVLAAALTALPVLAANVPGPLGQVFAQPAYACPLGGDCG